jgi:hypothetical protein
MFIQALHIGVRFASPRHGASHRSVLCSLPWWTVCATVEWQNTFLQFLLLLDSVLIYGVCTEYNVDGVAVKMVKDATP